MLPESPSLDADRIRAMAAAAGFEIAGIADARPLADHARFTSWVERGNAGAMTYLTDHRAQLRSGVRELLTDAQSVICVGKLYNGPEPYSTALTDAERGWIARYAWGHDYHGVLRAGLETLAHQIEQIVGPFAWKTCVDTAPVLERSLAREAGLGWIGKNTCLINEQRGSWFFLGELITNLPLSPTDACAPDRCGTCSRCIDACPTHAIVPAPSGRFELDARLCISYLTIEKRGAIDEDLRTPVGRHVFGCDICQDVCPWNKRAPVTVESASDPPFLNPPLERLAALTEAEFREMFRATPVERARYRGFLRNVAIAMGNSGSSNMMMPLRRLAQSEDPVISEHAGWALQKLNSELEIRRGFAPSCSEHITPEPSSFWQSSR